jgi:hypothetical protein
MSVDLVSMRGGVARAASAILPRRRWHRFFVARRRNKKSQQFGRIPSTDHHRQGRPSELDLQRLSEQVMLEQMMISEETVVQAIGPSTEARPHHRATVARGKPIVVHSEVVILHRESDAHAKSRAPSPFSSKGPDAYTHRDPTMFGRTYRLQVFRL